MSKSNYLEDAVLNWMRGTAFPAVPASVYVSLHTADPTDANTTTTEVSTTSTGYARVGVTSATTSWSAPADDAGSQSMSNSNAITFNSPTANWGTVTHFGIYDASTAGNLLRHGALGTSRNILSGDQAPSFAAGSLVIKEG